MYIHTVCTLILCVFSVLSKSPEEINDQNNSDDHVPGQLTNGSGGNSYFGSE